VLYDVRGGWLQPSTWMWEHPWDVRLHSCFTDWLRENWAHCDDERLWTLYRCPHDELYE